MGDVWTYLANNGPTPESDLPYQPQPEERADGIARLNPTAHNSSGTSLPTGGSVAPVYYINKKHSRVATLRVFLDNNPKLINAKPAHALHKYLDPKWRTAFSELWSEYYDNYRDYELGGTTTVGGTCPLCGEEYDVNLPEHLPCE